MSTSFETFGATLRSARKSAGRTMSETATVAGVSLAHMSNIEHDRSAPLTDQRIASVAAFLAIDPKHLLDRAALSRRRTRTVSDPERHVIIREIVRAMEEMTVTELVELRDLAKVQRGHK